MAAGGGPACPQCGLLTSRFDEFVSVDEGGASPELAALWEGCRAGWNDLSVHNLFLEGVAANKAYAYAARMYTSAASERLHDPVAKKCLARISTMAQATLLASTASRETTEREAAPYKKTVVFLAFMIVALAFGAAVVSVLRQRPDGDASRHSSWGRDRPVSRGDHVSGKRSPGCSHAELEISPCPVRATR